MQSACTSWLHLSSVMEVPATFGLQALHPIVVKTTSEHNDACFADSSATVGCPQHVGLPRYSMCKDTLSACATGSIYISDIECGSVSALSVQRLYD